MMMNFLQYSALNRFAAGLTCKQFLNQHYVWHGLAQPSATVSLVRASPLHDLIQKQIQINFF